MAALALQAHATWTPDDVRLAILNSADPTQLVGFMPRLGGSGLVQPIGATLTSVVARADDDAGSLSFGLEEFNQDFQATQNLNVSNNGSQTANFNVSAAASAGSSPHSSTVEPFLSVPPGQTGTLHLNLTVPAFTAGNSTAFREVAGLVTLSPASSSDNAGVSLNVPYYLVPLARSQVSTTLGSSFGIGNTSTTAQVSNGSTAVGGAADFFAWGLTGENSALGSVGVRAVGVQSYNDPTFGKVLVFAVNTFAPWSYSGLQEFDILVDVNGDGNPDYDVFSDDLGLITSGTFSGQVATFVLNFATNKITPEFFAQAPDNGSTILMPVVASAIGLTTGNPRFSYSAESFDLFNSNTDAIQGPAKFNAFENSITTAAFVSLSPGGSTSVPLSIDSAEWANTPALGEMIVSLDNFARAQQAQLLPVSGPPATTTNLSSSLNPSTYGQAVTFMANVTGPGGTPTGSVTFSDGATQLGTATLSSGNASFTTSLLTTGGHSITASYSGDTNFAAGISGPLAQTINQATSTTVAVSSTNPSIYGQPVTFTATVSSPGGTPTGTVTFTDGANTIGTGSVDLTGHATFTPALSVGPHSITATYGGDLNFTSSASSAISQAVNQASTTIALASGPSPSVYGQTVTLMATISPQFGGQASGFVTFNDGANTTTVAVGNNQASYSTNSLAAKTHSLSASYSGDANFLGSTSATVSQVVNKASSGTALVSSINPVVQGKPVKFTATVSPQIIGVPTGKVNFLNGSIILATHALNAGVATYSTSSLPAGTSNISAVYVGDGNFSGSASAPVVQFVIAAVTTVVTSSANPSTYGQAVTFTATLTSSAGPPPDGETVTFMKGSTVMGTGTLASGLATFTTSSLTPGTYSVKAVYAGDATFAASSSAVLKQTVNKAGTTIALTSSPNPSTTGTAVTFTATVGSDAGTPTGSVTFASDGTTLGSKSLSSGGATLKTSALTTGSHNITATYNGSSNFATSTISLTQTVQ